MGRFGLTVFSQVVINQTLHNLSHEALSVIRQELMDCQTTQIASQSLFLLISSLMNVCDIKQSLEPGVYPKSQ